MVLQTSSSKMIATAQWDRWTSSSNRGHLDYQRQAKINEDMYLGGGRQWDEISKSILEQLGKPWLEANIIFSTVNTVLGTQTQSRMDIAYKPRESDDQDLSDVLTKVIMFIMDRNRFPWLESQVFADGIIQQRGYYDIRMEFDNNLFGEITLSTLDPLDVIPDPDAKSYDPDDWQDVIITKWMTIDDIKLIYGQTKQRKVFQSLDGEPDFGSDGFGVERNKFATTDHFNSFFKDESGIEHVRVIERQWWKLQMRSFWFDPASGELDPVPDGLTPREANKIAKDNGTEVIKKLSKRVRWTVTTRDVVLHDEWSPYDHFTVVPFFPYFRRGVTRGLVDNLIKMQEMLNKVLSQILHIVNTTANSGWMVEESSLTNMDTEDLEEEGGKTGLVVEYKSGSTAPDKIEPNQVPTGLKDLMNTSVELIRLISGVSETFQGGKSNEVSGVAIQNKIQQSAVQLATPMDNLFRTRNLIADRSLKLMQKFITDERLFLITSNNSNDENQEVSVNEPQDDGTIFNDITKGKYDVVITDVPTQITFENAQFSQALEMRKFGIDIPDDEMILLSTLSRKQEIAKKVSGELSPEQQEQQDEELKLQMETLRKEIEKLTSEARDKEADALKKATEVAQMFKENPSIATIVDGILEQKEQVPPQLGELDAQVF